MYNKMSVCLTSNRSQRQSGYYKCSYQSSQLVFCLLFSTCNGYRVLLIKITLGFCWRAHSTISRKRDIVITRMCVCVCFFVLNESRVHRNGIFYIIRLIYSYLNGTWELLLYILWLFTMNMLVI